MKRMFFLSEYNANPSPCYADSMALLAPPGKKPVFTDARRPRLALAHLTSVPLSRRNFSGALSAHKAFVRQTLSNPGVRWVRTEKDIISLPPGDLGVLFGMQHAPEGMTQANMGEWRAARMQFMALAGADSGGLTDYGRKLVEWMAENGIILDLSHASHQAAREALEFVRQNLPLNVMASNSGCSAIFSHPRNLPDDILAGIVNQGGYVGIPISASLLAQEGDDPHLALIRHIAHAIGVCGPDNVGIGSGILGTHFEILSDRLAKKFSTPAVEGFLGRNFEYFLLRSLP
jgi:hypothetical protein